MAAVNPNVVVPLFQDLGSATFSGQIQAAIGSVTLPSYAFIGKTNTGLYYDNINSRLAFSVGGNEVAWMQAPSTGGGLTCNGEFNLPDASVVFSSGIWFSGASSGTSWVIESFNNQLLIYEDVHGYQALQMNLNHGTIAFDATSPVTMGFLQTTNGSAGTPSISFASGTNYGLYLDTTHTGIGFSVAGNEEMYLNSAGNLVLLNGNLVIDTGNGVEWAAGGWLFYETGGDLFIRETTHGYSALVFQPNHGTIEFDTTAALLTGPLIVANATPVVTSAGEICVSSATGVGNGGSTNLTAPAKSTGSGPASLAVVGFIEINVAGTTSWVPYFQ